MLRPTPRISSRSAAALVEQYLEAFGDVGHQFLRADADLLVDVGHGQHLPARLQTPSWVRLLPIAAASTTPASALKTRRGGRSPAGRRRFCAFEYQADSLQRGHPGRDGRAGQACDAADLSAGGNSSITNQAEHLASGHSCLR